MKKNAKPITAIIALVVVLIMIGLLTRLVRKYTPSSEVCSPQEYFSLNSEDEAAIVVDFDIVEYKGKIENEVCYVDYQVVKNYLNDCFYWDSDENTMIYTTPTDIITIKANESKYTAEQKEQAVSYTIVEVDGTKTYIALDFVKMYSAIDYQMFHEPDRVVIRKTFGDVTVADVRKKAKVRTLGGIKSPILREVEKNEVVTVLEDLDDWMEIQTQDGYRGYIRSDKLIRQRTETCSSGYTAPEYTSVTKDEKINLVWHQITSMDSNYSLIYDVSAVEGVNVISPTWFTIASDDGTLNSLALSDYVATAHGYDMEVWALIDNFSENIDFAKVMNTTAARTKIENQLIASAIENGFDGINVDFENITESAVEGFIQFMRELSVKCRKNGLCLSVDVPPPTFTAYYNRTALATVCDYVIMMGYDEHYYGSETAGSVASLSFEKDGITETLKEVPAKKLISAIPFYTRLWSTKTNEDGTTEVTSEAMGMNDAKQVLANNQVKAAWDEATSQNYAEFEGSGGVLYQIWLEDTDSLKEKLQLIKDYNLGGVAEWKLGFEDDSVWDLIVKYIS